MHRVLILFLLLSGAVIMLPGQSMAQPAYDSGAFIIKLGQDTVGVDKYSRVPDRVFGESILLKENLQRRYFDVHYENGVIQRKDEMLYNMNVDGKWDFEQHLVYTCDGQDTNFAAYRNSQLSQDRSIANTQSYIGCHNYLLMQIPIFPQFEMLSAWMIAAEKEKVDGSVSWFDGPQPFIIEKESPELVTYDNPPSMGKLRAHLDESGRMHTLEGIGTGNMQYRAYRVSVTEADALIAAWS